MEASSPRSEEEFVEVKCEIIEISDEEVKTDPIGSEFLTKKKRKRKPYKKDPSKAVQCETCARMLGDKHQLKKHMMVHTDERPFVCVQCGKAFRHKHVLKQHEMSHFGPKDLKKMFTCTECGASFTRSSSLNTHQRIHSGVRPFNCHICDKTFTQKTNLQQHIMAHQDDRPHECDECHKKFITRSKLKQHYQKHVKQKLKKQVVRPQTIKKVHKPVRGSCEETSFASNSPLWGDLSDSKLTDDNMDSDADSQPQTTIKKVTKVAGGGGGSDEESFASNSPLWGDVSDSKMTDEDNVDSPRDFILP